MESAIPPHIANSARNLYRECLRRAEYIGNKNGNRKQLYYIIRHEFRKNMNQTDPEKIKALKEAAVRGLLNHMLHEAWSMTTGQEE